MSRPLLAAELAGVITDDVIPAVERLIVALDGAQLDLAADDDPSQNAILAALTEVTTLQARLGSAEVRALLERAVTART